VSISTFLDTQESFQEAQMKTCVGVIFEESCQRISGPYLTTVQTSCQSKDLEKPQHGMFSLFDTLAITNYANSGNNGRPEVVCHLLSSCEHASITSKSDSKVFKFSDKFQRCAIVRQGGNRRVIPAEEDHDFCFVSVELEPFETCIVIEFVQLELQIFSRA